MRLCSILFAAALCVAGACNKDVPPKANCDKLKAAIAADNVEQAGKQINATIRNLASRTNTAENLNRLAEALSSCDLTATVLCFGCIQSLPEQSEIRIAFSTPDTTFSRIIDISYTPNNEMVFRNMHE
jgi:hypothetical protein